jgi:hypothetical protein
MDPQQQHQQQPQLYAPPPAQPYIPPFANPQPGGTQLYQHGYPPLQPQPSKQPLGYQGDSGRFSVHNLLQASPSQRHASINNSNPSPTNLPPSSQCSPADTVSSRPTPQSVGSGGGSAHPPKSGGIATLKHTRAHPSSTSPAQKRRRLHLNPPLHAADPSSIVVADMQNESDALHILAMASEEAGKGGSSSDGKANSGQPGSGPSSRHKRRDSALDGSTTDAPDLKSFALVKLGIISPDEVARLTDAFYHYHHHIFVSPSCLISLTFSL